MLFRSEYLSYDHSREIGPFNHPRLYFTDKTPKTWQYMKELLWDEFRFGNDMKDQNLSPYSWTKSKNIELIHNYKKWFNLNFAICYFYNVYGPGQICEGSYATVIGIFENLYRNNKPLTVVKPGTQTRCFTHIEDIVEGLRSEEHTSELQSH